VVTKEFSEKNGVTSLADLKKVSANAVLGGPSELKDREYGPKGLTSVYGATFKEFKPYDSPAVKVKDLNSDKIQVAEFFTTESAIADNGYVPLADPESMILPQNIIPLMRADVAGNTSATGALDAVQAALTTEELTALNKKVDVDRQDPDQVAGEWLKSKNLG
jgi:osmoprotectant transport system substrate-binding protein